MESQQPASQPQGDRTHFPTLDGSASTIPYLGTAVPPFLQAGTSEWTLAQVMAAPAWPPTYLPGISPSSLGKHRWAEQGQVWEEAQGGCN